MFIFTTHLQNFFYHCVVSHFEWRYSSFDIDQNDKLNDPEFQKLKEEVLKWSTEANKVLMTFAERLFTQLNEGINNDSWAMAKKTVQILLKKKLAGASKNTGIDGVLGRGSKDDIRAILWDDKRLFDGTTITQTGLKKLLELMKLSTSPEKKEIEWLTESLRPSKRPKQNITTETESRIKRERGDIDIKIEDFTALISDSDEEALEVFAKKETGKWVGGNMRNKKAQFFVLLLEQMISRDESNIGNSQTLVEKIMAEGKWNYDSKDIWKNILKALWDGSWRFAKNIWDDVWTHHAIYNSITNTLRTKTNREALWAKMKENTSKSIASKIITSLTPGYTAVRIHVVTWTGADGDVDMPTILADGMQLEHAYFDKKSSAIYATVAKWNGCEWNLVVIPVIQKSDGSQEWWNTAPKNSPRPAMRISAEEAPKIVIKTQTEERWEPKVVVVPQKQNKIVEPELRITERTAFNLEKQADESVDWYRLRLIKEVQRAELENTVLAIWLYEALSKLGVRSIDTTFTVLKEGRLYFEGESTTDEKIYVHSKTWKIISISWWDSGGAPLAPIMKVTTPEAKKEVPKSPEQLRKVLLNEYITLEKEWKTDRTRRDQILNELSLLKIVVNESIEVEWATYYFVAENSWRVFLMGTNGKRLFRNVVINWLGLNDPKEVDGVKYFRVNSDWIRVRMSLDWKVLINGKWLEIEIRWKTRLKNEEYLIVDEYNDKDYESILINPNTGEKLLQWLGLIGFDLSRKVTHTDWKEYFYAKDKDNNRILVNTDGTILLEWIWLRWLNHEQKIISVDGREYFKAVNTDGESILINTDGDKLFDGMWLLRVFLDDVFTDGTGTRFYFTQSKTGNSAFINPETGKNLLDASWTTLQSPNIVISNGITYFDVKDTDGEAILIDPNTNKKIFDGVWLNRLVPELEAHHDGKVYYVAQNSDDEMILINFDGNKIYDGMGLKRLNTNWAITHTDGKKYYEVKNKAGKVMLMNTDWETLLGEIWLKNINLVLKKTNASGKVYFFATDKDDTDIYISSDWDILNE